MRLAYAVATMCTWTSLACAQEDRSSGALFAPHCKSLLNAPRDSFMEGMCLGMLQGIVGVGRGLPAEIRFCQPPNNPTREPLAVVVRFLDAHPERLNEKFGVLALEAFRGAYPCP